MSELVKAAQSVATVKHEGQKYGDKPYTMHLQQVSEVLTRFGVSDVEMHAAAWLHDIVEDTDMTVEQVELMFGKRVSDLVYRVTNEQGKNRKERHVKTYIKIKACEEALQLKLADRIANVERSVLESNEDMMGMYKGEHKGFKEALYTPGQYEPMWRHLDFLIGDVNGD